MYNNKNVMADSVLPHEGRMRELSTSSDLTIENDDLSIQGDQMDLVEVDPEHLEDRFRVDRRKLEQMLQGG